MNSLNHEHDHKPNRFSVIPTHVRLKASTEFSGDGVTMAFLDSGFYPHPDLIEPVNRVLAYNDITGEHPDLFATDESYSWQWHGTQTSVVAAGNGQLSSGVYRGLAHKANLVLVKVGEGGRITEENIALGIRWVIENRERYNIRVLNISLGGDEDVPCSQSIIDQAAEEAVQQGIVVVAAAGNSGHEGKHSIPPANSPSVITVGGYSDKNQLQPGELELYQSNFGLTADGTVKPEVIAPAVWVAAPILPGTANHVRAESLSRIAAAADYELQSLLEITAELPHSLVTSEPVTIRTYVESILKQHKIVATHYQHVDGTSFAAPIVSSVVVQMLQANPRLTPASVKDILVSTATRIEDRPLLRQGYGVIDAQLAVSRAVNEMHALEGRSTLIEKNTVTFTYHNDSAESVSIAGDFNAWDGTKTPLKKLESGLWRASIPSLIAGRYEYKFLIDGHEWIEDPANGLKVSNNLGGLNSVLVVK